ncbi:hypothetical protein [uncultured Methylobacterium sp.]|uniref:hypothetical protein n=1 Tax=uncultured Methylobacterium sp. TaxID=157278 RepID=UPI0035CA9951
MNPSQQPMPDAAPSGRRSSATDLDREGFRPVALPALAAAVHAAGKPAARKAGSGGMSCPEMTARFQHEDSPLV